jgi:Zn finger protein HypA/HybF involved in hydrogenase expression
MHETRYINEIIQILHAKLPHDIAPEKVTVLVRLSPLSHVTPLGLVESFKVLAESEGFEKVHLDVKPLEIPLICSACRKISRITSIVYACPQCKSKDFQLSTEREFYVESLEY